MRPNGGVLTPKPPLAYASGSEALPTQAKLERQSIAAVEDT